MASYVFGIDVGGTTVKMGLFQNDGTVVDKWEIPTRTENGGEKVLPDIADAILGKMAEKDIDRKDVAGVGVGVPGPVDGQGIVHRAVNLGWGVFNMEETLSGLLDGMVVKGGNDANVAALGEMWKGGGQGFAVQGEHPLSKNAVVSHYNPLVFRIQWRIFRQKAKSTPARLQ